MRSTLPRASRFLYCAGVLGFCVRNGSMTITLPLTLVILNAACPSQSTSILPDCAVDVPVRTAYNQWTQFEEFPRFMEGVLEVRQLDDRRLHWRAKIGGQEKTWDAEITEQVPDDRIAWRARSGAPNAGVVTSHRLGDSRTRIMLQLEYEPR